MATDSTADLAHLRFHLPRPLPHYGSSKEGPPTCPGDAPVAGTGRALRRLRAGAAKIGSRRQQAAGERSLSRTYNPTLMAALRACRASISDLPFLEEMLFEAAFWRPSLPRPSLEVGLRRPELAKLLLGWGRRGDTALLAVSASAHSLGAAWYRFWSKDDHSYGFVSEQIPELAIGVRQEARGRGVGGLLLRELLAEAGRQGIAQVSLSVEVDNPALRLYERVGFEKIGREGNAWTMVANAAREGL